MKRTGLGHPKIKRLAGLLGISEAHAVGTLELLWHSTARYAIQGNIGKWGDAEIAVFAGWPADDAARLIVALVEARLVDEHGDHRLVVHDWHDHADDLVKKTIKAKGWSYANQDPESAPTPEDAGTLPEVSGKVQTGPESSGTFEIASASASASASAISSSCRALRFDETDRSLADWMWRLIQAMQPDRKEPDLDKWANTFRLLREQDQRTDVDIRELFAWVNKDDFWQTNILSPAKLRSKWDDLQLRRKNKNRNGKRNQSTAGAGQRHDPDAAKKDPNHGVW